MKLQDRLVTCCVFLVVVALGCNDVEHRHGENEDNATGVALRDGIDDRLDALSRRSSTEKSRFETRIGPQPWPKDFPEDWPRPEGALVVADTKSRESGRLLLIDLSLSIDEAFDSYKAALQDRGFEIKEAGVHQKVGESDSPYDLHVRRGRLSATLNFFRRDASTRLEILLMTEPEDAAG